MSVSQVSMIYIEAGIQVNVITKGYNPEMVNHECHNPNKTTLDDKIMKDIIMNDGTPKAT